MNGMNIFKIIALAHSELLMRENRLVMMLASVYHLNLLFWYSLFHLTCCSGIYTSLLLAESQMIYHLIDLIWIFLFILPSLIRWLSSKECVFQEFLVYLSLHVSALRKKVSINVFIIDFSGLFRSYC